MARLIQLVIVSACLVLFILWEFRVFSRISSLSQAIQGFAGRKGQYGIFVHDDGKSEALLRGSMHSPPQQSLRDKFSVIIVTHNEPLLSQTIRTVLTNTPSEYLHEVLIIDDVSQPPVTWDPKDKRVRIIRSNERLGLIQARYKGGNEALGSFLAFIDGHVLVGPNWLRTPHRYLTENRNTTVNFINFSLDAFNFLPKPAWTGIGSSASITADLRQFWGGGSLDDNTSPITMGMFATSKYWWNQGAMDPQLRVWGGENVEISLRYD